MKKMLLYMLVCAVFLFTTVFVVTSCNIQRNPPKPIIKAGDKRISFLQSTYCWNECADYMAPPDMLKHQQLEPASVSPEAEISIEFTQEPWEDSLGVVKWADDLQSENVPLDYNTMTAPGIAGIYIYSVYASWDKGSASYVFTIRVE